MTTEMNAGLERPLPGFGPGGENWGMRVRKRDGSMEAVDLNRIRAAVERHADGLACVDPLRVATQTIGGLYDGATTRQLDELSIHSAAALAGEEPEYGQLAARLLSEFIHEDVALAGVTSFTDSIRVGARLGLVGRRLMEFVNAHATQLDELIDLRRDLHFEYFGLKTVHDRYLLKHPQERTPIEAPQHFFLRVASSLARTLEDARQLYELLSSLSYLPSSPTLFNAGTCHEQMSSCFLLDSPADHLGSIYQRYSDIANLSKFSGGIGVAYHRVRSNGSLIESTNGRSNGIVPWLKTLDASVAAVNQGGKRKGACCVYLESWHADIEDFLELRDGTGDEARRTHNLNLANWVSDLFMRRVEKDASWSLLDPKTVPQLCELYGAEFERAYEAAEAEGLATKQLPARSLYGRMMRALAQTGNGWMTFKDKCNRACNQTALPGRVVHLSNLCTEIVEVTSQEESAVCNLGSLNLARFVDERGQRVDSSKLRQAVRVALRALDRVIDLNYYPIASTRASNEKWRPVGLGVMGLQDVFFQLGEAFDSPVARKLSRQVAEQIYFEALSTSAELAKELGAHPGFSETRAARGELQFDAWNVQPTTHFDWAGLRAQIQDTGLRNSLMIAIAPTATIASIAGCYECVEPQVSNLFKRETLSGDFIQVNRYLVAALKRENLWTDAVRDAIKRENGSIQKVAEIPEPMKRVYRTAWELPMRSLIDMAADRGAFVDQSQSLNLFAESPNIGALSSMYFYAWKRGLKTTYYLRSRPATRISMATVRDLGHEPSTRSDAPGLGADAQVVTCSLENPEACEACQ